MQAEYGVENTDGQIWEVTGFLEREQPASDHARQVRFMVKKVLSCEQEDGFADVVLSAELGGAFLAADDLSDEFEFEFRCVCLAFHVVSLGEGIPRSFGRGSWSQTPGFTSLRLYPKAIGKNCPRFGQPRAVQ